VVIHATKRTKRWLKAGLTTAGGGTPSVPLSAFILGRKKISGVGNGAQLS